jgi:hypothetical protein
MLSTLIGGWRGGWMDGIGIGIGIGIGFGFVLGVEVLEFLAACVRLGLGV